MFPLIAHAADPAYVTEAKSLVAKLESAILFPLMTLLSAAAFLIFLWGAYQFVLGAEDGSAREEGRRHMLYGIIGLLIIISAYGILKIAAGTFGVPVPS